MKLKHTIDLHKGSTALVVLAMMVAYDNFGLGPWVYLALHGTYGVLWVLKSRIFPDPAWEVECSPAIAVRNFLVLMMYWVAPFLLVQSGDVPSAPLVGGAVAINIIGTFLHFVSDAQKYYVLQLRRGLITEGLFSNNRNPNYLGEMLIYGSFALISMQWVSWVILAVWWGGVFVPNMVKKDRSLSRYPAFAGYRGRSWLFLPRPGWAVRSENEGTSSP